MSDKERPDFTRQQANSYRIDSTGREQVLLADLQGEIARLADAVERQNELLADDGREVER